VISACVPPFAHATFLEAPSLEETVEAAVDLAFETGEATIVPPAEPSCFCGPTMVRIEGHHPGCSWARLHHADGTPRCAEEIVDDMPF
jgi:hypothetical protein